MDFILRLLLTPIHLLLSLGWFVRRPRTFGAHALALTPDGKVILVRLRYAPGWRLPGDGRREDEDPRDAVLRELREEIGLVSHGEVRLAAELEEAPDFKRDLASPLVVRDVRYAPKLSSAASPCSACSSLIARGASAPRPRRHGRSSTGHSAPSSASQSTANSTRSSHSCSGSASRSSSAAHRTKRERSARTAGG